MIQELESLKKVINKLNESGFDYYLTGSMAMSFYAVPRMTNDADIVIKLSLKDSNKFLELFSNGFLVDEVSLEDSIVKKMMFNIFDKELFFKFDFIFNNDSEFEKEVFKRVNVKEYNGIKIKLISLEDLIISKLIWAKDSFSELQINDVKSLMKNKTDIEYIKKWVAKLNLNKIYERI